MDREYIEPGVIPGIFFMEIKKHKSFFVMVIKNMR